MTDTAKVTIASEGGHWYDLVHQQPRYEVIGSNGKMRKATLRDARPNGWGPGPSAISRMPSAPELDRWKQDQAIKAGRNTSPLPGEDEDSYMKRAREEADRIASEARDYGTEIHAAIECAIMKLPFEDRWTPWVDAAFAALDVAFGKQSWLAEKVACCRELGYGTKIDLHSKSVLLDWKGCDFTKPDGSPKVDCDKLHKGHFKQLWAGKNALLNGRGLEVGRMAIGFIERPNTWSDVTHPRVSIRIATDDEISKGRRMFLACRTLWIEERGYNPGSAEP